MLSVINIAAYRMRNAATKQEADEAYMDVLKATYRMNEGLNDTD